MAYPNEMSYIQLIEAGAIFVATDILRANLPDDYTVEREITKSSLPIVNEYRIDLGIKSKRDQKIWWDGDKTLLLQRLRKKS